MFNVDKAIEKCDELLINNGRFTHLVWLYDVLLAGKEPDQPKSYQTNLAEHFTLNKRINVLEEKLGSDSPKKELMLRIIKLEADVTALETRERPDPAYEYIRIPRRVAIAWEEDQNEVTWEEMDKCIKEALKR